MYPDSFTDNVADALRDLGHEVVTQPLITGSRHTGSGVIRKARILWDLARDRMRKTGTPNPIEQWLLKTVRERRPTVLLALTQSIQDSVLHELKSLGVTHRLSWWGDTPANIHRLDLMSDHWDAIFIKDRQAVTKLRILGLNAHYLHEAMLPKWHRPVATQANDSLVIAGNFYGPRQFLTRRLVRDGHAVSLYGNLPFSNWSYPEVVANFTGKYVVKEEKSRVFGEGLACLNSNALSEFDSLNCRAFEIAGAAGLQLIEDKPCIAECFEPGREILPYRTYEQLVEYLARAKVDRAAMQAIRDAAARRAKAEHTFTHRLKAIGDAVGLPIVPGNPDV
jgi:spore maturation protein CgeB